MKSKNPKKTYTIFYALLIVGIFTICQILIPAIRNIFNGTFFLLLLAIFFLLGIMLIVSALKEKVKPGLKKSFLLTGISSAGFFICVLLHNLFYALAIITSDIVLLNYLMEFMHAAFFLIAIFICPIGFLIGVIWSIVLLIKQKK